jgi:hypothetical protein
VRITGLGIAAVSVCELELSDESGFVISPRHDRQDPQAPLPTDVDRKKEAAAGEGAKQIWRARSRHIEPASGGGTRPGPIEFIIPTCVPGSFMISVRDYSAASQCTVPPSNRLKHAQELVLHRRGGRVVSAPDQSCRASRTRRDYGLPSPFGDVQFLLGQNDLAEFSGLGATRVPERSCHTMPEPPGNR